MGDIENKERKAHYKRIFALVLAVVLITQTFFSHGKNWFTNAQTSAETMEGTGVTDVTNTANIESETNPAEGINLTNEANLTGASGDASGTEDTSGTEGLNASGATAVEVTLPDGGQSIDSAGSSVSENGAEDGTTANQGTDTTEDTDMSNVANTPATIDDAQSEEEGDLSYDVQPVSVGLNANCVYLNPAGMTLGGIDWSTATNVYITTTGWNGGFSAGIKDPTTGYWYWNIDGWNNLDHPFIFTFANSWGTVDVNDYYRTQQSAMNLSAVKGKVFVQAGITTIVPTGETQGKYAYFIKEFTSLEGQNLYFEDYTNALTGVTACFSSDKAFSNTVDVETTTSTNPNLFSVTIPGEQKYVKFVDQSGNQLGKIYNLYGETETDTAIESILFASGTNDTLSYHVTQKADGSYVDRWGTASGTAVDSLAGKILYFDKSNFPVSGGGKLYIGDGNTTPGNAYVLQADESDTNTLSYQFPENTDATQQTILTFETRDGTKYHFKWSNFGTTDSPLNKVTLSNDIATVNEKYAKAVTVYYDATLSKLTYADVKEDYTIPNRAGTIRYYATGTGKADLEGTMEKVGSYTAKNHTWQDVYKVDLPEGYEKIAFSSFDMSSITNYGGHGESTSALIIPTDIDNPCFYADSSDTVIYDGGTRSGYWDEVYSIRNAETGKSTESDKKDVVDIKQEQFTRETGSLYVNSTFYDYYTDYELNGSNRDTYGGKNGLSHRNWVTFRHFNQALSDYYKENQASIPIYTGHFQPQEFEDDYNFSIIQKDLQLYGYDNYKNFNSTNNSNYDIDGNKVDTKSVAQGLVSNTLDTGSKELMIKTGSGVAREPHFDETFLTGANSKNTVLGEVYHNVLFPFTQSDIGNNGVLYWCFDSAQTTLAMKKDPSTSVYYLKDVGKQNWAKNVNSSSEVTDVSNTYGFFPFNETSVATSAKNYNYGFGVKLEFKFRLTSDGTVLDANGNKVPITFAFSGDDDVWVYIDDKLVLDVGGAHGFANGTIDFAKKEAEVDYVKASAGSTPSAGNYDSLTSNTYTNVKSNFELDESTTTEHTLTMYYMERGMWESNMKIQFNFPDENNLEVEKQVDETEVNELFKGLFEDRSLFTYHMKTQATHYGSKKVSTGDDMVLPVTFNDSFASDKIKPSVTGNTFEHVDNLQGQTDVAHWNANLTDTEGGYRDLRYGVIQPASGEPVDISKMDQLEFKYYYDYKDTPTLGNMYLQLVDTNGKIKGNITDYLTGKTYGIPTMTGGEWGIIKIDLSTLETEDDFNNQVAFIKFGYNYPRDFYLDDFIFRPSTVSSELIGFITKQYDIPDYGSATSGQLEIPKGAIYQSTTGKSQMISEDGTFVLQDKETITFSDQFRRGSYIYLEEESNSLFDTSWTMYENEQAVTSFGTGTLVQNGEITSLSNISGTVVNDDRTEEVIDKTETSDGTQVPTKNSYTEAKQPTNYETFVFRSYLSPDYETTTTKLKVVYTNKVKVGSLIISKESFYDNEELPGIYQFKVTFSNIGGISLENEEIETTILLEAGESYEIKGIPLGTAYTVEEVKPTDTSYLGKVEISDENSMSLDTGTQVVTGTIVKETADDVEPAKVIFKNTMEPKIAAAVTKVWKDEVTKGEVTENLPSSIYVQLQRKKTGEEDSRYTAVKTETVDYSCIELAPTYEQSEGSTKIVWKYEISGLDKLVDYAGEDNTEWIYRFVELTGVELDENGTVLNPGTVVEDGKVITITGSTDKDVDYQVQNGTSESNTLTGDYSNTITNVLLSDVDIKLVKSQGNQRLPGVTFKLEKLNIEEAIYEEWGAEATTSEHINNDTSTGGEIIFTGLPNGTYRLTELKTAEGYTLLKEPLIIDIDRKTATYTYRMESETTATNMELSYIDNRPTITLTIHNEANIILPPTGVNLPIPVVAIGILLCAVSGIMYRYDKRKCRKEGKPPGA